MNYSARFKTILTIVYIVLTLCFVGLPFSFLAFGSDIQTQQSVLYPYKNTIEIQDDFISGAVSSGTIGTLGWFVSGGTNTGLAGEGNAPGIFRKETTAAAATVAALLLSAAQTTLDTSVIGDFGLRARLNTNDANTTVRIGLGNACTVAMANGIYFEKLDGDTDWFAVTNNAGVQTRTTTGVAVNTSFNYFEIKKRSGAAQFFINGSLTNTNSTNLPVTDLNYCTQIINSAAANKTFDHEYFQARIYLSR